MKRDRTFEAFKNYLRTTISREWVAEHPDIVEHWWIAGICGGAFRAGYRKGKRSKP